VKQKKTEPYKRAGVAQSM